MRNQTSYTAGGDVQRWSLFGKQSCSSSNVTHRVAVWTSNSTFRYTPKRNENIHPHKTCTWTFTAALFLTASTWTQPKCPPTDEWICFLQRNIIQLWKGIKPRSRYNRENMGLRVLCERSQCLTKATFHLIPLTGRENRRIYRNRWWVVAREWGGTGEIRGDDRWL